MRAALSPLQLLNLHSAREIVGHNIPFQTRQKSPFISQHHLSSEDRRCQAWKTCSCPQFHDPFAVQRSATPCRCFQPVGEHQGTVPYPRSRLAFPCFLIYHILVLPHDQWFPRDLHIPAIDHRALLTRGPSTSPEARNLGFSTCHAATCEPTIDYILDSAFASKSRLFITARLQPFSSSLF
ncbi:hypothetical protein Mapa_000548 [Marchantia paleacea]|nr:hypothetical protein Mapa_000548 [Marchantia paleacea]